MRAGCMNSIMAAGRCKKSKETKESLTPCIMRGYWIVIIVDSGSPVPTQGLGISFFEFL